MSQSARRVPSLHLVRVSLPTTLRPVHSFGLAIAVTLVAAWAHASREAKRATLELSENRPSASIMIPVDEQLQPLGELVEIEGQRYIACPIEDATPTAPSYDAAAPWEPTGLPHPSSFVALCASVCFWLRKR